MQFNQEALVAKQSHLDEIKKYPELIKKVVRRNLNLNFELIEKERFWIGGGATSYIIKVGENDYFLKIKHKSVTVESKLEEEASFINEPCIEHEYRMLRLATKAGVSVPKIIFFDEESDFQFLATEYIEASFEDTISKMSLEDVLSLWDDLYFNVESLFKVGLVHSDIHEFNLRCREKKLFIIDFEEARELSQKSAFDESLDYIGKNSKSSLGEFPLASKQDYTIKINSLARMHQVFRSNLISKVREYIKECNYDSTNGICTVLDHGKSADTYQSIHNEWIDIKGQREKMDMRPTLIFKLLKLLKINDNYTFIDVGSNNGLFCRELSKFSRGKIRTIGLEGFHKFNVLARALSFIENCKNVDYYDFLCGEDNFEDLKIENSCFVSICSVWHHIQYKDEFLKQLNAISIEYIFLEMPIQQECYNNHSWQDEVSFIKEKLSFNDEIVLGYSHDYNRPLILLAKNTIPNVTRRKILTMSKRVLGSSFFNRLISRMVSLGK